MSTEQTAGTDLHTRIREALQRRIDLAKAATPGPWTFYEGNVWFGDVGEALARYDATGDHDAWPYADDGQPIHPFHGDPERVEDAEFIAANDPASTIRRAEAGLRTLDRHAARVDTYVLVTGPVDIAECRHCDNPYPCAEVRDLADGEGVGL